MKEKADIEGPPMTVVEIFDIVLHPKSGYVRGHDPSPKSHSKAHQLAEEQLKEPKERAKATEHMNEDLHKQMEELKAHQDGMEASIFEKLRAEMRQHYEEAGWTTSNSLPSFMNDNVYNRKS
ncbi:hypothetical protein FNV43_RR05665 [Rhamnella rubrinervis]|uniref:Uncharacterized protein n=1 Tax=Rhamnella rubrinervis TaxID=2594499 RepID=A0A8K0HM01_9ROSA|nr:hypothetical protein FNV43_RR05665 [Rhamnella rubrinervis]